MRRLSSSAARAGPAGWSVTVRGFNTVAVFVRAVGLPTGEALPARAGTGLAEPLMPRSP